MCSQLAQQRADYYEMKLLEIAALANDPRMAMLYSRPVQIAQQALEKYRRPEDSLDEVDLAEGEVAEQ